MSSPDVPAAGAFIRAVLGDLPTVPEGVVYAHEHLILDSTLIADRFPHIHLYDLNAAVREVEACGAEGVALMLDAMPISAGRDIVRLSEVSRRTGVGIVAATGLHHDRYYGPLHWTNRVGADELARLFVTDLVEGIDEFDYTGPIVRRTSHKAGVVKVATSGALPDARDRRNLEAVAIAGTETGAPILTHCESGRGGLEQISLLERHGVAPSRVILSHVDKAHDLAYLGDLASSGAMLELDQSLRQAERGHGSVTVRAIVWLVERGFENQILVGTDGARRDLWTALGGTPGLAWLARELPRLLLEEGITTTAIHKIMRANALRALRWAPRKGSTP